MHFNETTGQLFASAGPQATSPGQDKTSYQPARELPGEGSGYDALVFDMGAAGFEPMDWARPKTDLRFTLRQPTIPDLCRGLRLLPPGGSSSDYARIMLTITVSQVGGSTITEEDIGRWLDDLRLAGSDLVAMAAMRLNNPSEQADRAFVASRRYDPALRRHEFTIPREALPRRSEASIPDADLVFSMRELTFREVQAAADACDDPDDGYAIRVLKVMWSIASIGDRTLGLSPADLAFRRGWLAKVGHPAWLLIAGTWTRMHELDRGLVDRFLGSAVAPS